MSRHDIGSLNLNNLCISSYCWSYFPVKPAIQRTEIQLTIKRYYSELFGLTVLRLTAKQTSWVLSCWPPSTPWWFAYAVCAGSLPLRHLKNPSFQMRGTAVLVASPLVYWSSFVISPLVLLLHVKILLMLETRRIMSWQQKTPVISVLVTFMVLCQLSWLD